MSDIDTAIASTVLDPEWRRGLPQNGSSRVAYAPSGQHIAVSANHPSAGGSLTVFEAADGDQVHRISSDLGFSWLAYSHDSSFLAVSEFGEVNGQPQSRVRILHAGPGPQTLTEQSVYSVPLPPGQPALGLTFSNDGKWVVGKSFPGNDEAVVFAFDTDDGTQRWRKVIQILTGLALSPDSASIAAGGVEPGAGPFKISIRRTSDGGETLAIPTSQSVWQIAWSQDGRSVIAGFNDGTIQRFNSTTGAPIWPTPIKLDDDGAVGSLSTSTDGRWIAATSLKHTQADTAPGVLGVFNLETGNPRFPLVEVSDMGAVSFSPSLRHLISAFTPLITLFGAPLPATVFDARSGHELNRSLSLFTDISRSPDGAFFAGSGPGFVEVYDLGITLNTAEPGGSLKGIVMSPAGIPHIAVAHTAPTDDAVTAYGANQSTSLTRQPVSGGVTDLAFANSGQAVTAGGNAVLRTFPIAGATPDWTKTAAEIGGKVAALAAVGTAGDSIAVATARTVRVLRASDGTVRWGPQDHPQLVTRVAATNREPQWVATACLDKRTRIFDATGTKVFETAPADLPNGLARAVIFEPGGTLLAAGHEDGTVIVLDAAIASQKARIKRPFGCSHLAFSTGTAILASAWSDAANTVSVYAIDTAGTQPPLLSEFSVVAPVTALVFNPADNTLAVATGTARVVIIDALRGTVIIPILHPAPVRRLTYSADGTLLTTTCDDGKIRVFATTLAA